MFPDMNDSPLSVHTTWSQDSLLTPAYCPTGGRSDSSTLTEPPRRQHSLIQSWLFWKLMSSASGQRKEDRIKALAQPKVSHQVIFNRPNVYWTDKLPSTYRRYTVPVLTPRQEVLSRCKKVNPDFIEDRRTAAWPVTNAALNAKATPRLQQLAEPRPFTDAWELNRPPCPQVSKGALTAVPSERTLALAKPKYLPAIQNKIQKRIIHGPVVRIARFDELARPRIYTFNGRNPFKVSKAALDYVPSARILEISRPVRVKSKVAHQ